MFKHEKRSNYKDRYFKQNQASIAAPLLLTNKFKRVSYFLNNQKHKSKNTRESYKFACTQNSIVKKHCNIMPVIGKSKKY